MQSYDNISQVITVDYGNVQTLNHCSTVGCVSDGVLVVESSFHFAKTFRPLTMFTPFCREMMRWPWRV